MFFSEYRLYFTSVTECSHIFHDCEARVQKYGNILLHEWNINDIHWKDIEYSIYYIFYRLL